jgi:hypothetical protein
MSLETVTESTESFLGGIVAAAQHLIAFAANASQSIHALEASDPLVAQAIALAEKTGVVYPPVGEAISIAKAVLGIAQVMVSATSAAGAASVAPNRPST